MMTMIISTHFSVEYQWMVLEGDHPTRIIQWYSTLNLSDLNEFEQVHTMIRVEKQLKGAEFLNIKG